MYGPCLVVFDQADENLLRRQAFVSVDSNERLAYGQHFAEVGVFVRDALVELYDVCVVGHRDIDAIVGAAYEEVALHVRLLRVCGLWFVVCGLWFVVCGLWFVVCILRIKKAGAKNQEARPGGVHSDETQLRRRNDGVECRAFRPFGRWALSRNAPQSGVWTCPKTPQRMWAGIIVACGIRRVSGRRAPWRPCCIAKSARHFIHRIRQDDIIPILQTYEGTGLGNAWRLLCRTPIFIPQVNSVADLNDTA